MSTADRAPVVVAARRTPIGTAGGALRGATVDELAAPVLRALLADVGHPVDGSPARVAGVPVADVLLGNVFGPGGNPARVAALRAGLGEQVPGMTVDRQCASGLAAILAAATAVRAGDGEAYLAGGVESASTAPHRHWPGGDRYTRAPFAPAELGDPDMGPAADVVAAKAGISRQRQDAFAARSHSRAVRAQADGTFDAELVPVAGLGADQRPRPGFTPERLARFRPAFTPDGTATAANSCGVNDGAAAVLVVSERVRRALGVPGLALAAAATRGCDPNLLGLGAVPAMTEVLHGVDTRSASAAPGPPDTVEFTEAFAGQALACLDAAGVDEHTASPDGGAIALGHPWGASGAVLVVRLFSHLVRARRGRTGLSALSSGGGLGVAARWEVVS
ncbi:thiolase family protein [Pseudonocardia sp. KRD291]|uniref:thiolase family protein n=1 Tax=Pseudonocardia sp. KRD291 TaxID=2792007 RepID=UPI001C4A62F4|nr:thiolase family protein [Pseudonocardia sp. KRD291]MBW0105706.1 thiolase family protein [Pseudonocardia sp. KRD291]